MSYNPNFTGNAASASVAVMDNILNMTGSTITAGTPVKLDSSGELALIDPSLEADVLSIAGVVVSNIPSGSSGDVVGSGRLLNLSTSAVLGAPVFLSKTGGITDVKPDIGVGGFVSGDFVVGLGIIAKNKINPVNKDLILNIRIIGQL